MLSYTNQFNKNRPIFIKRKIFYDEDHEVIYYWTCKGPSFCSINIVRSSEHYYAVDDKVVSDYVCLN